MLGHSTEASLKLTTSTKVAVIAATSLPNLAPKSRFAALTSASSPFKFCASILPHKKGIWSSPA